MAEKNDATKRLYRIALLGLGSAGKTCALAALLLPKLAHEGGLTVAPASETATAGSGLERAIKRIKEGRLPGRIGGEDLNSNLQVLLAAPGSAAPSDREAPPQRFLIETFDYPGNLLNPQQHSGPDADTLQAQLGAANAFLVLIEIAVGDSRIERQQRVLRGHMLEQLRRMGGSRPIAILLTKWDRLLSRQDARPRYDGDAEVQHRPILDPARAAHDWLSTPEAREFAQFASSVEATAGQQGIGVFASSSLGEVVACRDIYRRSSDRLCKVWPLPPGGSLEEPAAGNSAPQLVYETKGRRFKVEKYEENTRSIEYRDSSGARAKVAFDPEDMIGGSVETRVNWQMQKGVRALASFGLEDALFWLVRRCEQKTVEGLEERASKLTPLSIRASWPGFFGGRGSASEPAGANSSGHLSQTASLIQDSRSAEQRLVEGSEEQARAGAVTTRVKSLRLTHLLISAAAALAVLLALAAGWVTGQDALWASGVKMRMTALDTTDVSTQFRDFQDMTRYQNDWLRHFVSYGLVWRSSDVELAREKLGSVVEHKIYDEVKTSVTRDPHVFLDPQPRAALSALLDMGMAVTRRTTINDILRDVRRRLVDLDQPVVIPQLQFLPATPDAHGSVDAINYKMDVRIDSEHRTFFQTVRRTSQLDQPAVINTQLLPTNYTRDSPPMQISGSLLRTLDSQLCFSEEVPAGAQRIASPICSTAKIDLLEAVRRGAANLAVAGPVAARATVEWHVIIPKVPQYSD